MLAELATPQAAQDAKLPQRVLQATEAALVNLDDGRLEQDLTCRLLIVYRCLLAERPMIADRASSYIDEQLLRLATGLDRVKTEQQWEFWAQAVSKLGSRRASKRLVSYVRTMVETEDLPEPRRKTLRLLNPLLSPIPDPGT